MGGFYSFCEGVRIGCVPVAGWLAIGFIGARDGEAVHVHGVTFAENLLAQTTNLPLGLVCVGWLAGNFNRMKLADFNQLGCNERNAKAVFTGDGQGDGTHKR